jgi:probable rRNA maturation factor
MILNRQRRVRLTVATLEEFLGAVRAKLRLPKDAVTVCLVTNEKMAGWNKKYRGKRGPTDVLSFPRGDAEVGARGAGAGGKAGGARPTRVASGQSSAHRLAGSNGASRSYLGDIAIAPAVARGNGRLYERTLDQELRILILHGVLHLLGYDHETDHGEMELRERRLRRSLGLR